MEAEAAAAAASARQALLIAQLNAEKDGSLAKSVQLVEAQDSAARGRRSR